MGLAAALVLPGLAHAKAKKDKRPNIVVLVADDQRFDAMGCMGNAGIKTPNMDKLGADGVIFDNHYDTSPLCMACRATIMTGMYEYKTGCNFRHGSLSNDKFSRSYPVLLRQAGYRPGFAGKFGFPVTPEMSPSSGYHSDDLIPMDQFDFWAGWPGQGSYVTAKNKYLAKYAESYPHVTRALAAAGQDFIAESVAMGKPFCLSVSFKAPHAPVQPDPAYDDLYKTVTFSKPANWGPAGAEHLPEQAKSGRQYKQGGSWYPQEKYQDHLNKYYRQIYGVDVAVGMLRAELERQGVAENTIIIYTSDNGYFCGSHHLHGKVLPYEEAARVPLIIYDPRHPSAGKGLRSGALTGNIDIATTILEMAGLATPENMDGKSLLPLLNQPNKEIRDSLLLIHVWDWSVSCQALSVVTADWKYIYWFYGDEKIEPAEELYDMRNDRIEMVNEAGNPEKQKVLASMRKLYDRYHKHWKEKCVQGNGYPEYIKLADRDIHWSQKSFKLAKPLKKK